jgi:hypothetical protein
MVSLLVYSFVKHMGKFGDSNMELIFGAASSVALCLVACADEADSCHPK